MEAIVDSHGTGFLRGQSWSTARSMRRRRSPGGIDAVLDLVGNAEQLTI
jgi:hypothetical protein